MNTFEGHGTPHVPSGFCPHCGYRMDAGVCPECGRLVAKDALATKPRRMRRTWLRRGIATLVVVTVCTLLYQLGRTGVLLRALPNAALLRLQSDQNGWASREVFRRLLAEQLDEEEQERALQQAMSSAVILGLDAVPVGMDTKVYLRVHLNLPDSVPLTWEVIEKSDMLVVDGERVYGLVGQPGNLAWQAANSVATWRLREEDACWAYGRSIPRLPQGVHEVVWKKTFALAGAPMEHSWDVEAVKTIVAVQGLPDDFVRAIIDPELASTVKTRISIPAVGSSRQVIRAAIPIHVDEGVCLAGKIDGRISGTDEYYAIGELFCPPHLSVTTSIDCARAEFGGASSVDIRIRPSAAVAVRNGCFEYFGGTIYAEHVGLPQRGDEELVDGQSHAVVRVEVPSGGTVGDTGE